MEIQFPTRVRQKQNIVLYISSLLSTLGLALMTAYILIYYDDGHEELKGYLVAFFSSTGILVTLFSSFKVAPWKEVIKLYLIFDSVVPIMVSAIIGYKTMQ